MSDEERRARENCQKYIDAMMRKPEVRAQIRDGILDRLIHGRETTHDERKRCACPWCAKLRMN